MILSGVSIQERDIIVPFYGRTKHNGMTFGCGPAGYDVRVEFDREGAVKERRLWPGHFMLASTIEQFRMPNDLLGIVHDKSTWARKGIACQNTVIEPGWEGYLTLEITNHGPEPIVFKRGDPIAQIIFHVLDKPAKPYDGKYHNQERGPVDAKFEGYKKNA